MDKKADLDWVAHFDEPAERPPRSRALTIALGTLFGAGGLAVVVLLVIALTRPAVEEEDAGAPTRTPSARPAPTAVQTSIAEPSLLPSECAELYGESMTANLEQLGFALGSDYDGALQSGSADSELGKLLDRATLDCHWSSGDDLLLTRVMEVGGHVEGLAIERLESLGSTQLSENGGVRYVIDNPSAAGASGESHFFRDGLWFATYWRGHGQYGYTADMVTSVFG